MFLDDCNIKNGTMGVHLVITKEGRPSGVAYLELESQDDMELAYKKDGQYLGERYIEGKISFLFFVKNNFPAFFLLKSFVQILY